MLNWFRNSSKKHELVKGDLMFFENQELVKMKLAQLRKIKSEPDTDGTLYIDDKNDQKWEKYEFDDFDTYRDINLGLRAYPYPCTTDIIKRIIDSDNLQEIEGASRLLHLEEYDG